MYCFNFMGGSVEASTPSSSSILLLRSSSFTHVVFDNALYKTNAWSMACMPSVKWSCNLPLLTRNGKCEKVLSLLSSCKAKHRAALSCVELRRAASNCPELSRTVPNCPELPRTAPKTPARPPLHPQRDARPPTASKYIRTFFW